MGSIKVGDRIGVGIDRGVVCYVGPVDGYKGDWIGVDWDDPKRGKHDGTVNGRSYFHATGKTSGSFVRASKVDTGKTITEEMESRYAKDSKMDQHEIGAKTIELVNMEKTYTKQKNLWKLSCVVLDNKNVAKPPLADCPPFESCKELNLYNNLIAKWSDLFAILDFFPSLLYLNVRRNIMEPRMSSVDRKVKSPIILLVISECHIDEETAKKLMQIFPRLAELYISRNGLKYFDPGDYGRNLTVLDLEGNPINDFTRLHNLASLPRLVSLNLTECGLTAIRLPDPVGFYALKTLIMRNNDVHDWESVSEIAKLPALQQLLYNGNWQVKPEFGLDVREVLIAKLPKLIDLERSEISPVERRSAEIRFLNKYSVSPVCQQHVNDIERLKRVHGEPDIVNQTMNLGLSLIELNVTLDCKSVKCSFLTSTTVARAKGIIARIFHANPRKISLTAECGSERFRLELDNPLRSIDFYSLADGDTVIVTVSE